MDALVFVGGCYLLGLALALTPMARSGFPLGLALGLLLPLLRGMLPQAWRPTRRTLWWGVLLLVLAQPWWAFRTPHPAGDDISGLLTGDRPLRVELVGVVQPPLRRQGDRLGFDLDLESVRHPPARRGGRLVVSGTLRPGAGDLEPGDRLRLSGWLRRPAPARNPGEFDSAAWLARRGVFAQLRATHLERLGHGPTDPFWRLGKRIRAPMVTALGEERGSLLAAIALGNGVGDPPSALRQQWSRVGLSHALAASGFQVALLLGFSLKLTDGRPAWVRFVTGTGLMGALVLLAGPQPSLVRALLMGEAQLWAAQRGQRTRPLRVLALTGLLMLLWQPVWLTDLGFLFSFLATFGLVVAADPIQQRLDWLPTPLAVAIAVPAAATLWTLPLQWQAFGTVSVWAIPVNVLATLPLTGLSLLGFASGAASLVWAPLGQGLALLAGPLLGLLLGLVAIAASLPGAQWVLGALPVSQALLVYGLMLICTWPPRGLGRSPPVVALLLVLLLPGLWQAMTLTRLSWPDLPRGAAMLVQEPGRTGLVARMDAGEWRQSLRPWLRQQGIRQLDWGLMLDSRPATLTAWAELRQELVLRQWIGLPTAEPLPTGAIALEPGQQLIWEHSQLEALDASGSRWRFRWRGTDWTWRCSPTADGSAPAGVPQHLWQMGSVSSLELPSVADGVITSAQCPEVSPRGWVCTGDRGPQVWHPGGQLEAIASAP